MARGLAEVFDAFIDGAPPKPGANHRLLRVPLAPGNRLAAAVIESIAAELRRLRIPASVSALDPGARALCRSASTADSRTPGLTFEIATLLGTPRAQSVLLMCSDLAAVAEYGLAFDSGGPARELLLVDLAADASESAAIQCFAGRLGARWIGSVPASAALRTSLSAALPNSASLGVARALENWLRAAQL